MLDLCLQTAMVVNGVVIAEHPMMINSIQMRSKYTIISSLHVAHRLSTRVEVRTCCFPKLMNTLHCDNMLNIVPLGLPLSSCEFILADSFAILVVFVTVF